MPFDIFDTYYMAGMVQEIAPVQSFFRDRYFPTNAATDIFNANKVLVVDRGVSFCGSIAEYRKWHRLEAEVE